MTFRTGDAADQAETSEVNAISNPESRASRERWITNVLPALSDEASREVHDLVLQRLREKLDADHDDLEIPRELAGPPPRDEYDVDELDDQEHEDLLDGPCAHLYNGDRCELCDEWLPGHEPWRRDIADAFGGEA